MPKELLVDGLPPRDAGRGIARISRTVMDELGVAQGDIVSITGRRKTVAKVRAGYERDPDSLCRIDGNVRANADVVIDDTVTVERAATRNADEVTIALPGYVSLRGAEPYLKQLLVDRPVVRGDVVHVRLLGQPFAFLVTSTTPTESVIITERTDLTVRDEPISPDDLQPDQSELPRTTYEDIGGLDRELDQIREMIELPLRHPELFQRLGIAPPKGVLLHGPPGTGKTLIAKAVANEVNASFFSISGPEIMSKYYGESEGHLREVFDEAAEHTPAVVFIDELDSIAPSRDRTTGEVERRVVAQLLSLMDGLDERGNVVVIAATNRVDAIDPALRRGGRFDREIEIGVPDKDGRKEILQVHTRGMPLSEDVDIDEYAENTHGFVGADIESLAKESAMNALRRVRPQIDLDAEEIDAEVLESIRVTEDDFRDALKGIEPSALREVFVEVPDTTWENVGGLEDTKERLRETIQWPLEYPEVFESMDLESAKGVLLYGPPGTGKTLLAKAVANEANSNFISVKGPELLNKYVGESEKGVREVFEKARSNAPTVVFFDEIDSIAGQRGRSMSDSGVGERVVSQLLTELDGIEELEDVVVVATTNRPDLIDSALLRPGRLDRHVHVPVPDEDARRAIFDVHTRNKPLADDVDLDELATRTDGFVGADIEALCREATMNATREFIRTVAPEEAEESVGNVRVTMAHFEDALDEVGPSVDEDVREQYDEIEQRFQKAEQPEHEEFETSRAFQ